MNRTVILSASTVAELLEAHASLAAWYHAFATASQTGTPVRTPDVPQRKAFLERVALDFPEIASVARGIDAPRLYVPPPPPTAPPPPVGEPT
jgi:hypothetical protein